MPPVTFTPALPFGLPHRAGVIVSFSANAKGCVIICVLFPTQPVESVTVTV